MPQTSATSNTSETLAANIYLKQEIDFRQEIIYFLIVDRFCDGSSEEEERAGVWDRGQRQGLYDKTWTDWGRYWGGNLQGIIDNVDYLKGLGTTAVWLSPLFEQVDDMQFNRAPMHGYWTQDFKRINPRFLPLNDSPSIHQSRTLRKLVDTLHNAGIKIILDVVCNHSSPDINGIKGRLYDDGTLIADYYDDKNNFYYHNDEITDWEDEYQLINYEMCGLATFNERNIEYRQYIKSAIKQWLDIGVDALRIDTIKHMPIWFWQEFSTEMKKCRPGLFLFGEYGFSKPWEQRSVDYANHAGMSILDFGLCDAIRCAFSGREPGGFHQIDKILAFDHVYHRANELVTFLDNHDMPRFLSIVPDNRKLSLATILLMTLRGVPCIFYGTEQYLNNNTNGGEDPYNRPMMECWDTKSTLYILIQKLAALRNNNPAITLGSHQTRYVSEEIYAFERAYRDSSALTIINNGPTRTITIDNLSLTDGNYECALTSRTFTVTEGSLSNLELEAHSGHLLHQIGAPVSGDVICTFQLNGFETKPGQSLAIIGSSPELGNWDHAKAYGMEYVNSNTWIAEVAFDRNQDNQLVDYKYIVLQDGDPIIEYVLNRRVFLPETGRVKLDNQWNRS
jgi:cyclomaltodextrin glucanotransferase